MERVLKEEVILHNSGEQWSGSSCKDLGDADPNLRQCTGGMWEAELSCRESIVPTKNLVFGVGAGGTGCMLRRG